jgi:16S rRNA (cytosine967-C5)-methyltransferase
MLLAALHAQGQDAQELFSGSNYGLPRLLPDEELFLGSLATLPIPPVPVQAEVPEWIYKTLALTPTQWQSLTGEAPFDLRVNALKAARPEILKQIQNFGYVAQAIPCTDYGIRLPERQPLDNWQIFQKGLVEVQDASSQIAAAALGAQAGMNVLDYCAGAGGKTLAIAAAMQNKGRITATDTDAKRLANAKERLARAGVDNASCRLIDSAWRKKHKGLFDRIFVDAPCTGSGTWRRNPDARLRTTPEIVTAFQATQRQILQEAIPLLKKGGYLLYATCSLLVEENAAHDAWIGANFPQLKPLPLMQQLPSGLVTDLFQHSLQLTPWQHGCDGFYLAMWSLA